MTKQEIEQVLKQDLGVKKDIIALKPLKAIPDTISAYEGLATPGLCAQIGQVVQDGSVFYTVRENHQCFEGLIATGVCAVDREEYRAAFEAIKDQFPYHRDVETCMRFYEKCIQEIKLPKVEYKYLVVGPLSKVENPDLALIFCTPKQCDILIRIWAYQGNLLKGYGGNGGCIFTIRPAFVTREPCFSTSDLPWRMFIGLSENELTITFPYEKLVEIAPYVKSTAEYVSNFDMMVEDMKAA